MDTPTNSNWQLTYQYALGALIVFGFLALLGVMIIYPPAQTNAIILTMTGSLGTMTAAVVGYFFGSSKGSSDKTSMIYNSTPAGVKLPVEVQPLAAKTVEVKPEPKVPETPAISTPEVSSPTTV